MNIDELDRLAEAPEKGQILAYTRKKVVFHPYDSLNKIRMELEKEDILELHMFDDRQEYRCIVTESRRFPKGVIEYVTPIRKDSDDTVFQETIWTEPGYEPNQITVLNYIEYDDDNGMARIDDYRLKCEGGKNYGKSIYKSV